MRAVLQKGDDGALIRNAGIMTIVLIDGEVRPGDAIHIGLPEGPHLPLDCV